MQDLRFVLSPYVFLQAIPNPSPYGFSLYRGPKYVGSQVCTQSLRMYVGYTESFSVRFFCTIEFLCMQVEQNIQNVNILIELAKEFFSWKSVARGWSVTPFFQAKRPLSPPKKKNCLFFSEICSPRMERYTLFWGKTPPFLPKKQTCLSSEAHIRLIVQNFNINVV